jgi:hypothetical protein
MNLKTAVEPHKSRSPGPVEGLSGIYVVYSTGVLRNPLMLRLGSQETVFMHIKSTTYKLTKKLQNRVKQRLFHGNAMRPKGLTLLSTNGFLHVQLIFLE